MTMDDLVAQYVKLRQKKAEKKAAYEASVKDIDAVMDKIEAVLLETFNKMGVDSIKTPHGTAYTTTRTSATVADWDAFFAYVQKNKAFELLEHRVAKTAVEQFKAANDELPPGINWSAVRAVNFRAS